MDPTKQETDTAPWLRSWAIALRKPRPVAIWLGLIGFVLGVTLCAFNPLDVGRDDLSHTRERKDMTTSSYSAAAVAAAQPVEAAVASHFETATFALG